MIGFILSMITATCTASKDFFVKSATKKYYTKTILWALFVFASLLLSICFLGSIFYFGSLPELKSQFWIALVLDVPLLILANHFYIKALKLSEMSFCLPLLSFTPIGIVPIAAIFLGEKPTVLSLLGICLIIIGSFVLGIKKLKDGLLEPIKNILKDKGAVYMLTTAFIWSITSVIDKFGIKGSIASPFMQSLTWATTKTILIMIVLTIIFVYQKQKSRD
ncbi:MAG: DMT family transporter, partial [Candidatus Pacebacteria bacterium]|nr:DMT family transporter [Candidatus Paceibacterota bacterium]